MQPPKILNNEMCIEQVRDQYFMKLINDAWRLLHESIKQSRIMTVDNIIPYLKLKTCFDEDDIRIEIKRLNDMKLIIIYNNIITKNIGFDGYYKQLKVNIKQYNIKR